MQTFHLPRLSFKLRIALLSMALSGVVLAAFGGWALAIILRMELTRVDGDIQHIAGRHIEIRRSTEYWSRMGQSLQFLYGEGENDAFILYVRDRDGKTLYQSPNWPESLTPEALVPSKFEMPEPPDAPMFAGPPEGPRDQGPFGGDEGGVRMRQGPGGPPGERMGPPVMLPPSPPGFLTREANGQSWRIAVLGNSDITLVLGLNLKEYMARARYLRLSFGIAFGAALFLIAGGGWLLSQRALRPVQTLSMTVEGITAKGLSQRIPLEHADPEFMRLITVFNEMMDRLEKSFHQATRFSADAAHELKTPLTILQGELEQALQAAKAGSPHQQRYSQLLGEVQRLKSISRKLLLLSLADTGQLRLHLEPVNISEAIESMVDDIQILAPGLTLKASLEPDVFVMADPDLLNQVLQNLASNAIKYNHPDGKVALELRKANQHAFFRIGNTGPGIPTEDRERVFERFYRGDKAHNRAVDGMGLGLSLAREIIRAHNGKLELEPDGGGMTIFAMALQLAPPPGDAQGL